MSKGSDSGKYDGMSPSSCKYCGSEGGISVTMSRGAACWIRYRCGTCNRLLGSNRTEKVSGPCGVCGVPVTRYRSQMQETASTRLFCSRKCFGIGNRENPDRVKPKSVYKDSAWWRNRWQRLRLRAMEKVNPALRCRCGCDVLSIL